MECPQNTTTTFQTHSILLKIKQMIQHPQIYTNTIITLITKGTKEKLQKLRKPYKKRAYNNPYTNKQQYNIKWIINVNSTSYTYTTIERTYLQYY